MGGASLYLADISTPRNRAQTTAPILQSALIGYAVGPAVGGLRATAIGLHLPFTICAAGLAASSIVAAALLPETLHEAKARTRAAARLLREKKVETTVAQLLVRAAYFRRVV